MHNKYKFLLEVVILIVALFLTATKVVIPDIKEKQGSSETLINTKNYVNLIEIKINKTNFGLVIDNNKRISHIYYFDKTSVCLYNKNIENNKLSISINKLIKLLIENDILKNNSQIVLTKYEDKYYYDIKSILLETISSYNVEVNILEEKGNIFLKTKSLTKESVESKNTALLYLDIYSKELADYYMLENINTIEKLDEKTSKIYANNIYKEIEKYVLLNDIKDLDKDSKVFDIKTISGDKNIKIYPTSDSYYYVKSSKVYAYIKLKDEENYYDYCYNGSIDNYKKGECE